MNNPTIGQLEHFLMVAQMNMGVRLDKKQVQQLAKEIKELQQNVKVTEFVQQFSPDTLFGRQLRKRAVEFVTQQNKHKDKQA